MRIVSAGNAELEMHKQLYFDHMQAGQRLTEERRYKAALVQFARARKHSRALLVVGKFFHWQCVLMIARVYRLKGNPLASSIAFDWAASFVTAEDIALFKDYLETKTAEAGTYDGEMIKSIEFAAMEVGKQALQDSFLELLEIESVFAVICIELGLFGLSRLVEILKRRRK